MNFIEAVIKISQIEGFEFCEDEDELSGRLPICIYQDGEFAGKLRWPNRFDASMENNLFARVDKELEDRLLEFQNL